MHFYTELIGASPVIIGGKAVELFNFFTDILNVNILHVSSDTLVHVYKNNVTSLMTLINTYTHTHTGL